MERRIRVCFREKWYHLIHGRYPHLVQSRVSDWLSATEEQLKSFLQYRTSGYDKLHQLEIFVVDNEDMYRYEINGFKYPSKSVAFAVPSWCR